MRHSKSVRSDEARPGLETAPTGPDKSGSKPRGESVYLFLEFTMVSNVTQARSPVNAKIGV